jgi:hypothetical protein
MMGSFRGVDSYVKGIPPGQRAIRGLGRRGSAAGRPPGARWIRLLPNLGAGLGREGPGLEELPLGPSKQFAQTCDESSGSGRTYLTIDTSFADLPVESNSIDVTYQIGDNKKVAELEADIVLCDSRSGCPPEPDDDF